MRHSGGFAARDEGRAQTVSTDEYTLVRIAQGDETAVADCMKRYSGLVWSLVRSRLGNSPEAEDLTQEIFIEIWKSAERFNPEAGSEAVFIATITRRRVIDRLRSLGRKPETEEFDETAIPVEGNVSGQIAVDADLAQSALSSLREDQRALILMGVVEGMTHSEIATATGKPLGTVKTQMRRGLAKVRAMLEEAPPSEDSGADDGKFARKI
jgi:RNA polymerase sigma-70 factor (ECF subfamily)